MKKLLILLLLPLLFACSSDDDKEPAIEYINNRVIEGKWVRVDGIDTNYLHFENNIYIYEVIHTYTGDVRSYRDYGEYKLTKDYIYYDGSRTRYSIKDNIITLHYPNVDVSYTKVTE